VIVMGGCAGAERAVKEAGYDVTVPFSPGQTDASQDQPDVGSFDIARDPTRTWRSEVVARTSASAHVVVQRDPQVFAELTTRFPDVEITGPPSYLVSAPE
jgi:catalase (peroxidase I)